jgi:hypothetical protein
MKMFGLVIIQLLITFLATWCIIHHIEKHSVHPVYGNYVKTSADGMTCEPWDSCR